MRRPLLAAVLLLSACRDAAPEPQAVSAVDSACADRLFEGTQFTVCAAKGAPIEIRNRGRGFADLGLDDGQVRFAMNAGMFDEEGKAIGLLVEDGRTVKPVNRNRGGGNFHLLPNGVFLVRDDGRGEVVATEDFEPAADIAFATQSGPMLVIDGQLHPRFDADGQSRLPRNGVGIAPDGTATFVISDGPVSFGKFARFFRDAIKARNALFLDGSVSSLWDPANHRMDAFVPLGPMVIVRAAG